MVCVKCGRQNRDTTCRNCGYNHSLESIVMLEAVAFGGFSSDLRHPDMEFLGSTLIAYTGHKAIVHIPEGVTDIGPRAFYENKKLREITIPGTVTKIDELAFYCCRSLKSVRIHEGLKSIGDDAFFSCRSLVDITLPDTLVSIGKSAFFNTNLNHVVIPGTIRVIEEDSFWGCSSLGMVYLGQGVRTIKGGAFYGCAINSIYVPDSLEDVKSHWNETFNTEVPAFSFRSKREIHASEKWKRKHPTLLTEILGKC